MIGISAANSLKGVSGLLLLPLQLVVVSPLTLRHISPVHGLDLHRLLNEAGEEQAPGAGSPAIEAESQLVQVVVEVEWGDGSVVGTKQPSLEQRGDTVDTGHHVMSELPAPPDGCFLVPAASAAQPRVALPAVPAPARAAAAR